MNPSHAGFVTNYAKLGEPELMEMARNYDALIGEAQAALREEFARRGLKPPLVEEKQLSEPPAQRNLATRDKEQSYRYLCQCVLGFYLWHGITAGRFQ